MSTISTQAPAGLKPTDFASDQEVKWCPGCGDYSVLAQTKRILAKLGYDRANTAFISGIGCSSRFPYYMGTYGFHSIHGRAPTVATGLKLARPDLNVFIITGDGDALSIGGNHFIHLMRRNVDVKIILFNNKIYGLTKGQYSPTSEHGKKTKSSPMGTVEDPIRPISVALGAGASFAARAIDADVKHLEYVLERAARHHGTAFVEVYQNCVIFNDGAYAYAADKDSRPENIVYVEDGKPLIFGKDRDKGIRLNVLQPEIVNLKDVKPDDLLHHNEKDAALAFLLSQMCRPELPEPVGVFRDVDSPIYSRGVHEQIEQAVKMKGEGDLQKLLTGGESWKVE